MQGAGLSFGRQVNALERLHAVELRFAIVFEHQPSCHKVAVHVAGVDAFDALALDVDGVRGGWELSLSVAPYRLQCFSRS